MIISVASGKGGTGKTTVAVSLALAAEGPVQFVDCDVEEPNAHIFLKPEITESKPVNIFVPKINSDKCDYCGKCADICVYNALAVAEGTIILFEELCHSCGGCWYLCPQKAIGQVARGIGMIEKGRAGRISFVHGRLKIGVATVPPLIDAVREEAEEEGLTVIDAPPGTSCPVVSSVRKTDFCLLVTEPTPFGLNDLSLAVELTRVMGVPCGVIINRSGTGDEMIERYCRAKGVPVMLKIPQDRSIAMAYSRGIPLLQAKPEYAVLFRNLILEIEKAVAG